MTSPLEIPAHVPQFEVLDLRHFAAAQLRPLLEATEILRTRYSKHVPAMYRTMLLLLYGTGMRVGEALRLTPQNIDLTERIISVLCSKFLQDPPGSNRAEADR